MARPRTKTVMAHVPSYPDPTQEEVEPERSLSSEETEYQALETVMADLAGAQGAKITVYRLVKNSPMVFLFDCQPDSFSLNDLRDRFNGGSFRLYISRDGKLWKNKTISVEAPIKPASDLASGADLVIAMREGFERQGQIMRDILMTRPLGPPAAPVTPAVDFPSLIQSMSQLMGQMRPSVPVAAPSAPAPSMETMLNLVLKGIEIGREVSSAATDDGGIIGVVRDLIKSPILEQALRSAVPSTATAIAPTSPVALIDPTTPVAPIAPRPATQPVQTNGADNMNTKEMWIRAQLHFLVNKAEKDSDPELYAAYIVDNLPLDDVIAFIDRPDALEQMISLNPKVGDYRSWFESLRDEIKILLTPEDDSDIDDENVHGRPSPGNARDSSGR